MLQKYSKNTPTHTCTAKPIMSQGVTGGAMYQPQESAKWSNFTTKWSQKLGFCKGVEFKGLGLLLGVPLLGSRTTLKKSWLRACVHKFCKILSKKKKKEKKNTNKIIFSAKIF